LLKSTCDRPSDASARLRSTRPRRRLDHLDDHLLIELDGVLYAITARWGRTRLHVVGTIAAAAREVKLARIMLRRRARGRLPHDSVTPAYRRSAAGGGRSSRRSMRIDQCVLTQNNAFIAA
jgi:hypothetical protein